MTTIDADARIGKKAAVAFLCTVVAGLVVGPLGAAANLIAAQVTSREPNPGVPPGARPYAKWAGNMPFELPWWLFLLVSLAFAVLLFVVWKPTRRYAEFWRRKVILIASPNVIALAALVWAMAAIGFGGFYSMHGEWIGYVYIPAAVALAVAIVAFVQARRTTPLALQRRARGAGAARRG